MGLLHFVRERNGGRVRCAPARSTALFVPRRVRHGMRENAIRRRSAPDSGGQETSAPGHWDLIQKNSAHGRKLQVTMMRSVDTLYSCQEVPILEVGPCNRVLAG